MSTVQARIWAAAAKPATAVEIVRRVMSHGRRFRGKQSEIRSDLLKALLAMVDEDHTLARLRLTPAGDPIYGYPLPALPVTWGRVAALAEAETDRLLAAARAGPVEIPPVISRQLPAGEEPRPDCAPRIPLEWTSVSGPAAELVDRAMRRRPR